MRTGRPPKPDSQKVTRHASTKPKVSLPATGRTKPPDALLELSVGAAALWGAMWRRPEASRWADGDVPTLTRLVMLQTNPEHWADPRLLAEMRQLEDRFGMNPQARQAMGWSIDDEATKPAPAAAPDAPNRKAEAMRLIRGEAG